MDVAIAGGHGKIGIRLGRLLAARGDRVRGLIRKPDESEDLRAAGIEPVICDLEQADAAAIAAAVEGADAVVFAAGAGPGSGEQRKFTMDRDGAIELMGAAEADGIDRYLMVSSRGADSSAQGGGFNTYLRAKGEADDALLASDLQYTIVRPGRLTDDPGTGRIEVGDHVEGTHIARDDVAATLLAVLDTPSTARKLFEVVNGDMPIEEAIAAL